MHKRPYLEVDPSSGSSISLFIPPQRLCPMTKMFSTYKIILYLQIRQKKNLSRINVPFGLIYKSLLLNISQKIRWLLQCQSTSTVGINTRSFSLLDLQVQMNDWMTKWVSGIYLVKCWNQVRNIADHEGFTRPEIQDMRRANSRV